MLTIGLRVVTISFLAFILWVIYLANTGSNNLLFDWVRTIPNGDKWGHCLLFGLLTLLLNLAFKLKVMQIGKLALYWGTVLVAVFVVAEELSQAFIPSRTFDWRDLFADAIGIASFTLISWLVGRKCSQNVGAPKP